MPYGDKDMGQHWLGSGNGLLPANAKPLFEPMCRYDPMGPVIFTLKQFLNTDTKLAEKGVYCIYLNLQN